MEDVVVGQYRGRQAGNRRLPGYVEDKTVPKGRCASDMSKRVCGKKVMECRPGCA